MIRTRFAPSPTGHLHIGGARVALFCWLFAKKHKGQFWLRIEDTDQERSTENFSQSIVESLQWLELDFQGPVYQSSHLERYKEVLQQLLNKNQAYRCYCSKQRLQEVREQQLAAKQKPRYDGHCRALSSYPTDKPHVVRFRNPTEGTVKFADAIHGDMAVNNTELDDLIIFREDGFPTYNFAAVVDDLDMQMTHVIRGDDHLSNTFRQLNIIEALEGRPPVYAHVPMILGQDGQRLSKRHGAASVLEYRTAGYLPDALLNYLVRLGWSHGDQEIFTRQELIEYFDLNQVHKSPAAFDSEKLNWLNQQYLKNTDPSLIMPHLAWHFNQLNIDTNHGPKLVELIPAQRERSKTLAEMADKSRYFYQDTVEYDAKAASLHLTANLLPVFQNLVEKFSNVGAWEEEGLHQIIMEVVEQFQLKMGQLAQPLRVAMTGNTISPPIGATLQLIGKARTLVRLEKAIEYVERNHS